MQRVLVINGPNLNLLGMREPEIYGTTTLAELEDRVVAWGADLDLGVETFQSNHEGAIIDRLHSARNHVDGVIVNAGALSHSSYAIHDAIAAIDIPTVEVHISNIHAREQWRRTSVTAPACVHQIFGRGLRGYRDALAHLVWRSALPFETLAYGTEEQQVGDLRLPDGDGPYPIVVIVHGGFWREVWTRDLMDGIAVDLTRRGWATWNIEYRRVGTGGGWPTTFEDAARAVDFVSDLAASFPIDTGAVVTLGHSAGGHLALWMAARTGLGPDAPGAIPQVMPRGAVGLAPVTDLAAAYRAGIGDEAVEHFLHRGPDEDPDTYASANPAALLPMGVRQLVVHGDGDQSVPIRLSEDYVGRAADSGDAIVFHELTGADHFSLIDVDDAAWSSIAREIEALI
jgi:3-dehydroquinate dehydratase type II